MNDYIKERLYILYNLRYEYKTNINNTIINDYNDLYNTNLKNNDYSSFTNENNVRNM